VESNSVFTVLLFPIKDMDLCSQQYFSNTNIRSIQVVSRLVDITAGGDFLGLCDQKVHINMCPILDG